MTPRPLGKTATRADPFDAKMFEKRNDRYLTPLSLIQSCGEFDLDPCGAPGHPTAKTVWTPEDMGDGLSMPWFGRVWLNPPYGRTIGDWVARLFQHGEGVALIPCSPDTEMWQGVILPRASSILFVRGRIRYLNSERPSNHASALVAVDPVSAEILARSGLGISYTKETA